MPKSSPAEQAVPAVASAKRLRALRAQAHALKPVVRIASTGPTDGMMRELDRALSAHELVKIHADIAEREERRRLLLMVCEHLGAEPVQTIGKMLIAYRARPQPEAAAVGAASEKKKPGKRSAPRRKSAKRPSRHPAKRAHTPARRT